MLTKTLTRVQRKFPAATVGMTGHGLDFRRALVLDSPFADDSILLLLFFFPKEPSLCDPFMAAISLILLDAGMFLHNLQASLFRESSNALFSGFLQATWFFCLK